MCMDIIEMHKADRELRNGIVPASAPGMATQNAAYGQIQPFERTVLLDRFDAVLRAGRRIAARSRRIGRYAGPIEIDREQQKE